MLQFITKEVSSSTSGLFSSLGGGKKKSTKNTDTTYVVYIDRSSGLIGGAKLQPITQSKISRTERFAAGLVREENVWECSQVFFDIEGLREEDLHQDETQKLIKKFYSELYKGLQDFAVEKRAKMIVTHHTKNLHQELRFLGQWSFHTEMKIEKFETSPVIMGILDLQLKARNPLEILKSLRIQEMSQPQLAC